MKTKILADFQICISVRLKNSHFILIRGNGIFQIVSFKKVFGFCFFYLSWVSSNLIFILHLEFKILFSHFAYVGTQDTFQVSSWKSVSVFRLSKLNEDEVCGSADSIEICRFDWKVFVYLPFIFSNLVSVTSYL